MEFVPLIRLVVVEDRRRTRRNAPCRAGREAGGRPGHEQTTVDESGRELRAAAEKAAKEAAELAPALEIEPETSAEDPAEFLIAAS